MQQKEQTLEVLAGLSRAYKEGQGRSSGELNTWGWAYKQAVDWTHIYFSPHTMSISK